MIDPNKKAKAQRLARLQIVAKLHLRGHSLRSIRAEVMRRLSLPTYSLDTVRKDVLTLQEEWRSERLTDYDQAVSLELARIDTAVSELWAQWELSKTDHERAVTKRRAHLKDNGSSAATPSPDSIEETREAIRGLGNVAYMAEIRQQLIERRKILGLYSPEKREITADLTVQEKLPCEMTAEEIDAELRKLNSIAEDAASEGKTLTQ